MKFSLFLKDKFVFILLFFLFFFLLILLFFAFKVPVVLSNVVLFSMLIFGVLALFLDYFRKKSFYNTFLLNLEHLDKKYLVLETLERPRFYEGQLFYDAFYEINKAMNEYIKNYEFQNVSIIHGTADKTVLYKDISDFCKKNNLKLTTIEDGKHELYNCDNEIVNFLLKNINRPVRQAQL